VIGATGNVHHLAGVPAQIQEDHVVMSHQVEGSRVSLLGPVRTSSSVLELVKHMSCYLRMIRYVLTSVIAFLSTILICGCPFTPLKEADPIVFETKQPQMGSTFIFLGNPFDTKGRPILDSNIISEDSILEINLTLFGKTNVSHFLYTDLTNGTRAEKFFNYEPNGDISLFIDSPISKWITFPVKEDLLPFGVKLLDTTIAGVLITILDTLVRDAINTGDKTNPFVSGPTVAINETCIKTSISSTVTERDTTLIEWIFAPKIGHFYSVRLLPISPSSKASVNPNNLNRILTSYIVK
jgi:hypothetical protein